jgi:hypothetical protein
MKKIITCLVVIFAIVCVNAQQQPKQENAAAQASASTNTKLTYKIIDVPNHTYGYDVFADGKLPIHQTSIPVLPHNEGFKTKADASKLAQLVIEKMKKRQMPPTVTVEELKKLKVIK